MQIKASLQPHKKGFYITFTPGIRVSIIAGEHGYEPRRPYMTVAQKQEFGAASARLTNEAILGALEPIAGELRDAGLRAEDVLTVVDVVDLARAVIRGGRLVRGLDDVGYAKLYSMMGEPLKPPSSPSFDFADTLKSIMGK